MQLYHRINYRWYLKTEWRYPSKSEWHRAASGFAWHPEVPLEILHWGPQASGSPEVHHARLAWDSACSAQYHKADAPDGATPLAELQSPSSVAAVIDGPRVLLTDLGLGVTPPPMCGRKRWSFRVTAGHGDMDGSRWGPPRECQAGS